MITFSCTIKIRLFQYLVNYLALAKVISYKEESHCPHGNADGKAVLLEHSVSVSGLTSVVNKKFQFSPLWPSKVAA